MQPKPEIDSLRFEVSYFSTIDTVTVRMKTMDKDSLIINSVNTSLKPDTAFQLRSTIPLLSVDDSKASIYGQRFVGSERAIIHR